MSLTHSEWLASLSCEDPGVMALTHAALDAAAEYWPGIEAHRHDIWKSTVKTRLDTLELAILCGPAELTAMFAGLADGAARDRFRANLPASWATPPRVWLASRL
jgi:hypothetical protein